MLHVVLVEPEIPWNTGNAGRSCLAFGAQLHLVRPLGFSLDEADVRRAGLDYWARVAPVVWPSWTAFEAELPGLGVPLFLSAEADRPLWDAPEAPDTVLVFGKESVGLSPEIRRKHAGSLRRIPMRDAHVRALNLSTCVGIALYERARPRI